MDYNKKKSQADSYLKLNSDIKEGNISRFFIFYGEERYLLEHSLSTLRLLLCPEGQGSFNFKRFDGNNISAGQLGEAVDTLPVFAERTLIEVHDFDIFAGTNKERLHEILTDLPDYVCIIFVYSTIEYKPDGRLKTTKDILKNAYIVEFCQQEKNKLVKWIKVHFQDAGKTISAEDAEYLAFITGGLMTSLHGEIEKVSAYATTQNISRSDIDTVVTPVLDAVSYKLTDCIINRKHKTALKLLDDLFQMREAPHKLIYTISLRMRQLLAAKICIDKGIGKPEFMAMCGINYDIQARSLIDTARNTTLSKCKNYILECSHTALELNSTTEPESRMIELIGRLSVM